MNRVVRLCFVDEEPHNSSAVPANSPLIISCQVTGAGNTKLPQAVTTADDVESITIAFCRDGLGIFFGGTRTRRNFLQQLRHGFEQPLKPKSILVEIGVGGYPRRQFLRGHSANDNDGDLREALTHDIQKLDPRHSWHLNIGEN